MAPRFGFVATGGIATVHAKTLLQLGNCRITAFLEPNDDRARAFAALTGARRVTTVSEVAAESDGVYLSTPPGIRVDIIRELIAAGVPIFCEKPMSSSVEDAATIADMCRKAETSMMLGFSRRYYEPLRRIRKLLNDGAVGKPLQVHSARFGRTGAMAGNWRISPGLLCGMAIESVSHDIDILRSLLGDFTARGEVLGSRLDTPGFDDNISATLRFANGAIGTLQASWSSPMEFNRRIVLGTEAALLQEGMDMWAVETIRIVRRGADDIVETYDRKTGADRGRIGQARAFIDLVVNGTPPEADFEDGLKTVRISHQILGATTGALHEWADSKPARISA